MEHTKLVYLEEMSLLTLEARVLSVEDEEGRLVVILDQTVFYPQGGGQPFDQGFIRSASASFRVEEVRFMDGIVKHIGSLLQGELKVEDTVQCEVDGERRSLHSRLHSAGHVIDLALLQIPSVHWTPGKGYHFPQGSYIEYAGSVEEAGDVESFRKQLEEKANVLISRGDAVTVKFMPKEEMYTVCHSVPDYLPANKPLRVVMYGAVGIPCGGTHVGNLSEIGLISIRKIKKEKDAIRVSYSLQ